MNGDSRLAQGTFDSSSSSSSFRCDSYILSSCVAVEVASLGRCPAESFKDCDSGCDRRLKLLFLLIQVTLKDSWSEFDSIELNSSELLSAIFILGPFNMALVPTFPSSYYVWFTFLQTRTGRNDFGPGTLNDFLGALIGVNASLLGIGRYPSEVMNRGMTSKLSGSYMLASFLL